MKDKIIIVVLILLLAGVGRSHYKIKRIEAELATKETQLKYLNDLTGDFIQDIHQLNANQEVMVNYLFPEEVEVRIPIQEPKPFN